MSHYPTVAESSSRAFIRGCVCNEVLLNLLLGMDSGRYAPKWIHNIILCFKM